LFLLEQALASLSDLDREVLLLVGVEGLPHERAACILGVGEAAFRKRLSRARERLELALDTLTMDREPVKGASRV
jgi:RNA polymerase sigma-70 factor (ECF subfamily)